jgi:trehalose 6-phosphate synthase
MIRDAHDAAQAVVPPQQRLVLVSNRLPIVLDRRDDGSFVVKPGSGGLVTAFEPVLKSRGGLWIGWPGVTGEPENLADALSQATHQTGYDLKAIPLSDEERDKFYYGYSNEVLWPLFHDLQEHCNFDPTYEQPYIEINKRFAQAIRDNCTADDFIWVQDYQLMYVAQGLMDLGFDANIAFFLHTPFPPVDIYMKLPGRTQLLRALLQYDLIGLQTIRDRRNFIDCVRYLLRDAKVRSQGGLSLVRIGDHETRIGSFPIGIDYSEFADRAAAPEVGRRAQEIHDRLLADQLLFGVDRLDYTKGIRHRLNAFRDALRRHPDMQRRVTFIQVVVPSRTDIPMYAALKTEIEQMVSEINGEFTTDNWVPVHYVFRSVSRDELLALYRACEIAMVTPLKDGMNLVAKEFCAANPELNGVLVLSEFAGAAAQLGRSALLVNPYDVRGMADAIHQAIQMSPQERRTRMRKLRRIVQQQDVHWWVNSFLHAAFATRLTEVPQVEEYIPREQQPAPNPPPA